MSANSLSQSVNFELERTSGSCGGQPVAAVSAQTLEAGLSSEGKLRQSRQWHRPPSSGVPITNSGGGGASPDADFQSTMPLSAYVAELLRRHSSSFKEPQERKTTTEYKCGSKAVISRCEQNNHHIGKLLLCQKDWCVECGQIGSKAHNQRISHWLPKMQQLDSVGYLVIEFPDYLRHTKGAVLDDGTVVCSGFLFSKVGIKYIEDTVKDVIAGKRGAGNRRQGGYFKRGVARWHWFGSRCVNAVYKKNKPTRCKLTNLVCPKSRTDCENYKNDGKLNQHINVLADGAYLEADKLAQLKADLRQALKIPNLIINYEYVKYDYDNQDAGQIYHKIAYVTRPTFLKKEWDYEFAADVIKGLHSGFWWGSWKSERIWEINPNMEAEGLQAAAEISNHRCHICHSPLHIIRVVTKVNKRNGEVKESNVYWSNPISSNYLTIWKAEEIGNTGYYNIPTREYDGDAITPEMVERLQSLPLGELQAHIKRQRRIAHTDYMRDISELNYKMRSGQLDNAVFQAIYENVSKDYQRKQAQIWGCQGERTDLHESNFKQTFAESLDDNYFESLFSDGGSPYGNKSAG